MKAIEEERDGLMRGMQMVARADEWYQEQLANVQERMRNLGKMGGGQDNPGSTEAARERLLFQNARSGLTGEWPGTDPFNISVAGFTKLTNT